MHPFEVSESKNFEDIPLNYLTPFVPDELIVRSAVSLSIVLSEQFKFIMLTTDGILRKRFNLFSTFFSTELDPSLSDDDNQKSSKLGDHLVR